MKRTIPVWRAKVAEHGDEKGSVKWARSECSRYHCSSCGKPLFGGGERCRVYKKPVADELDRFLIRDMEKLAPDLIDHLKEVSWVLFLVYLFLGLVMLLFGRSLGYDTALWVYLGLVAFITAVFGSIVLGNLLLVGIMNIVKRFLRRAK
jgi:hypothetical protein